MRSTRILDHRVTVGFGPAGARVAESQVLERSRLSSNGRLELREGVVRVCFSPPNDFFTAGATLEQMVNGTGVAFQLRLSNWRVIRYLAVGYSSEEGFRHIKIPHPPMERWFQVGFDHDDLGFRLQNRWRETEACAIHDLRLAISGQPSEEALLEWQESLIWRSVPGDFHLRERSGRLSTYRSLSHGGNLAEQLPAPEASALNALRAYLTQRFPDAAKQAESFIREGSMPLCGGINLAWPAFDPMPPNLAKHITFRFSWHALHSVILCLVAYRAAKARVYYWAARHLCELWLERSFFEHGRDDKYEWYDHGAADRLFALLLLWAAACDEGSDHRFLSRLLLAIQAHAELLSSEMFYASHQPTRFHNHAVFQDLALLAVSLALPWLGGASLWCETATTRLTEQVEQLVARDHGFAVCVENSIDYHRGLQSLLELATRFFLLVDRPYPLEPVLAEMVRFSSLFRYPDGRHPANGDSFRLRNAPLRRVRTLVTASQPGSMILPQAGYAVVQGTHGDRVFMLTLLATSLCSTHKHEDHLSFTLFFDGLEWLIDPSFYSHDYAAPLPAYLRSAAAHNALFVHNQPYSLAPGLARLRGHIEERTFVIGGEHRAFRDIVVTREIHGRRESLDLQILDRAEASSGGGEVRDAAIMLHCGDGVVVTKGEGGLHLNHPHSDFTIELSLPRERCSVFCGQDAPAMRGVTGLGFMERTDVCTIECAVSLGTTLEWNIIARSLGKTEGCHTTGHSQ